MITSTELSDKIMPQEMMMMHLSKDLKSEQSQEGLEGKQNLLTGQPDEYSYIAEEEEDGSEIEKDVYIWRGSFFASFIRENLVVVIYSDKRE